MSLSVSELLTIDLFSFNIFQFHHPKSFANTVNSDVTMATHAFHPVGFVMGMEIALMVVTNGRQTVVRINIA